MDAILSYFPELSEAQVRQLSAMRGVYEEWNARINVISRRDLGAFYERHVLHSLAIGKIVKFSDGTEVMDLGTGGGFPGIPLAILFPEVRFHLVDSVRKKIRVVESVVERLGLENVVAEQARAEDLGRGFDFVLSRAVASLSEIVKWSTGKVRGDGRNSVENGLLCLKGGDLEEEIEPFREAVSIYELRDFFSEDFFKTKKLLHVRAEDVPSLLRR